ncbi:uncharacterized protein NdufV3 [Centruroides vittatus]|uniref:uncharacterized protein NdufV3 n=1 Tax=Centruroides vittatus TaxID=120091 RepID=UPI0035109F2D
MAFRCSMKLKNYTVAIQRIQKLCTETTETSKPGISVTSSESSNIDDYKVPEYYEHNKWTFVDLMLEMEKLRLPQPSAKQ